MEKRICSAIAAAIVLSASQAASAEALGRYVLAFGGQSSIDTVQKSVIDDALTAAFEDAGLFVTDGDSSLDDTDTMFGLTLGYKLNPYFAAELSYVDLGSATYRASGTVSDGFEEVDLNIGAEASASGPVASVLLFWPVHERFSPYFRAGIALMDTEAKGTVAAVFDGEEISDSVRDSTTRSNAVYGVGGDFSINDRFGVRLEWSRYADVGSEDVTGEGDVDTYLAAIRFQF